MRVGIDRKIKQINDAFCDVSGYSREELIGADYSIIKDNRITDEVNNNNLDKLQEFLNTGKVWKGKVTNTDKNGKLFHSNLTIFPLKDKNGKVCEYLGVRHDITELENLHIELE